MQCQRRRRVLALEAGGPFGPGIGREQAHRGHEGLTLARPALARHADASARADDQGNVLHRLDDTVDSAEADLQAVDFEKRTEPERLPVIRSCLAPGGLVSIIPASSNSNCPSPSPSRSWELIRRRCAAVETLRINSCPDRKSFRDSVSWRAGKSLDFIRCFDRCLTKHPAVAPYRSQRRRDGADRGRRHRILARTHAHLSESFILFCNNCYEAGTTSCDDKECRMTTFAVRHLDARIALIRNDATRVTISEFDLPEARRLRLELDAAIKRAEIAVMGPVAVLALMEG